MPNTNISLTGKFPSQTWTNQIIKDDDGLYKTGDGKQISYYDQGGINIRTSDDPNFWTNNPKWLFDLQIIPINYGRYVLSGLNYTGVSQNSGIQVINNDSIFRNYFITANFSGRFYDSNVDQYNRLLTRLVIDGITINTASSFLFKRSNNSITDYRNMANGSINYVYGSNTSWNLDFLVTTTLPYGAGLADVFRFDSFWWTVSTI